MLKLQRRCVLADPDGRHHEFRVVATLSEGTLVLLPASYLDQYRLLTVAGAYGEVVTFLRDHVVALDPKAGRFLKSAELLRRLSGAENPLLRLASSCA